MAETQIKQFERALRQAGFIGDIDISEAGRTVMATDNSVYEVMPQAVLYPQSPADVQCALALAAQRFPDLTFTPRGGGTSTNGQSLGEGILLDCSRYLRAIKHLDLVQNEVVVEAGVVLDELNRFLAPFGLFFPVAISTGSRATLGGMFNTNACGKGSAYYGRMSDNVRGVTAVLANGRWLTTAPVSRADLPHQCEEDQPDAALYRQVLDTVTSHASEIRAFYPRLVRTMTGYTLAEVWKADHFDLTPILAGAEGTLGIVTELRLAVRPLPRYRLLAVLQYPTFMDALDDGMVLANAKPVAIETMDEKILSLAKQDPDYPLLQAYVAHESQTVGGLNLVEWTAETESALAEKQKAIECLLQERDDVKRLDWHWVRESRTMARLWELRKKCVGLLGNFEWQGRRPVSGIEDTLVPVDKLKPFIHALQQRMEARGLTYGMYGHADAGCIHVRPAFNLRDVDEQQHYMALVRDVATLVHEYQGILWGEHGKGFRSEFVPAVFGERLFAELCKIKAAFDPANRLNPGKIALVSPTSTPGLITVDQYPLQGQLDHTINSAQRERYHAALACNGNGACFNQAAASVMCPSYKATRERIHSPKGRARLARQWLRHRHDVNRPRDNVTVLRFLRRLWQPKDFSHAVYHAMAGCLGCRGCQTQCPVQVDVPSFKANFLASYHSRYARSLKDYLLAQAERFAWWQAQRPTMLQRLLHNPLSRIVLSCIGLVDLPRVSTPSVSQQLAGHPQGISTLNQVLDQAKPGDIVLLQDFVTSCYDASLVVTIFEFLQRLGQRVWLLAPFLNGKPWHAEGMLENFHVAAKRNLTHLQQLAERQVTLVGIDPSITLTYRHEYREAMPNVFIPRVLLLQELLQSGLLEKVTFAKVNDPITLLLHCTEQISSLQLSTAWEAVFAAAGYTVTIPELGCCGMAGGYGLQRQHRAQTKTLFTMDWGPWLTVPGVVLATGYSCRSQVQRFSARQVMHPVMFLAQHLEQKS